MMDKAPAGQMWIKVLEESGIKHDPYGHLLKDEVRLVSEEDGKYFVGNGWAEDTDGKVPTGERDLRPKVAAPASLKHDLKTSKPGG